MQHTTGAGAKPVWKRSLFMVGAFVVLAFASAAFAADHTCIVAAWHALAPQADLSQLVMLAGAPLAVTDTAPRQVWIRGPQLRERWGGMPNSTFYDRLKKRLIPQPHYPFGESTPYWRLEEIEAHEQQAMQPTTREAA
jgi:predicted DNA-binding transcriptional regulator AlpA